jgi:hypothetical protein
MPQFTFTSTNDFIRGEVQPIADKENRSLSEMIDILLRRAVKEKYRKGTKKNGQNNIQHNTADPR